MNDLQQRISDYLENCHYQKNLNEKTIRAYRTDLKQFLNFMKQTDLSLSRQNLTNYITYLHKEYSPKSAKRKIASLKAFFNYMEYEDFINENPFSKIKIKFQEPFLLPRTISSQNLQKIFSYAYINADSKESTEYQKKTACRDVAVIELLFAAGLWVSELCSLRYEDVNLKQGTIRIYGKGAKERIVQITNSDVIEALKHYQSYFNMQMFTCGYFFVNRLQHRLSEQSVRFMIRKFSVCAGVREHITPHMFRHTFATLLLEEDVDIRYIQQILGHSSIMTTQIYTHVSSAKQRDILTMKHPRNKMIF